ncbi:MAG: response regulator [Nitrospirota bacterium]
MDKKNRILIVDDNTDTVELLRKRLRSEGYETEEAYDGEECLRHVDSYNPDLIVLDVMMPKLNGYEVCERLKTDETTRYIPILMLTAKSDIADKVKGLDIGADDYLAKPFDYKELSARVRSLLGIKAAREKLVEVEKTDALGQMMDEVAHEVRNPLVSIGGFARRVHADLPEGNPNRKYLEMIIEEVARLETIVKQLIEIQTVSLSYLEPTDINEVILQALNMFEDELEERAVDVETELTANLPMVNADKEQLKKAIANLIKNAVEAMVGETRLLKITSRISEGRLDIKISDSGRGISRDKLKSIFDPLFTSKIYGPGLGLTFSLKIIQAHRGTISVESEEGKGTVFTISLPVKKL